MRCVISSSSAGVATTAVCRNAAASRHAAEKRLLAREVVAHGVVAQLEQRGACERGCGLELLVALGAGVEVDARDRALPAALAAVVRRHLLDEAVLGERAQVVAAATTALSPTSAAHSVAVESPCELEVGEDPQARGVPERPQGRERGQAWIGQM